MKVQDEAKDTKSFYFKPEKPVKYLPGQYFYFTLPNLKYKNSRGPTRHFTLSSSPTEKGYIRITTRMRYSSMVKKTYGELKVGEVIEGDGPSGTFIIDEKERGPHVFLAGGIGITPARSAIKYHLDKGLKIPILLIYSNQVPEQITFRKELEEWSTNHKNIKVDITITSPIKTGLKWSGLKGRIDAKLINKLTNQLIKPTFWATGHPSFVEGMQKALKTLKIPPTRIRSEKFTGY